jgi:predicted SAM-dependent methyltransferase
LSRVLNIGSGAEQARKLPAINIDISVNGRPEVVATAQHLPFANNSFSIVRASHILEHISQDQIIPTLQEWRRVLHVDGELHIAVPDAEVAFKEIIDGQTPKGSPSVSFTESTAPLAQIFGLGYNSPDTDERWRHRIIFNYELLKHFLKLAGFTRIERRTKESDLAYYCNVDDDSQNHYSLLVTAGFEKSPHVVDEPLSENEFIEKCHHFCDNFPKPAPTSFIVPIHNEEKNLANFLASLSNSSNRINAQREFIFVINGCTDKSEEIVTQYLMDTKLLVKLVHSKKGILTALQQGVRERTFYGFVGKLDADSIIHPHALDLMQMYLSENPTVGVTYSEPQPRDSLTPYNQAEHIPQLRSKRLFFHGRTSLYRDNPFAELVNEEAPSTLRAEDYFFSFFFTYFKGLSSIARTPHAIVYGKSIQTFNDLATQITRASAEIDRVCAIYPPFAIVRRLLDREIFPGPYKDIVEAATGLAQEEETGWTRLESTK